MYFTLYSLSISKNIDKNDKHRKIADSCSIVEKIGRGIALRIEEHVSSGMKFHA